MRLAIAGTTAIIGILLSPPAVLAQSSQPPQAAPSITVPRLLNINGVFRPADGGQPAPVETVTLAIYAEEAGGAPLWQETQSVAVESSGRYALLLGATEREGVPLDIFASGEPRWLGITWYRSGEAEGARTRLASVPYALKASDADTLGGRPASAYMAAPGPGGEAAGAATAGSTAPLAVNPGTTNVLAKYVNPADVGNSALYESGGMLGINTTTPFDVIHSRFSNDNGTLTGLVVQNLSSAAGAYSGMLFRDQTGAVGMFQGFNNSTHEYRINNVATGGSINFMVGSTSRLKVDNSGTVLIGTTTPETHVFLQAGLQVRQATGDHGIMVRKPTSDSFAAAINARSDVGITGVLIKAIAGVVDGTDHGGNAAVLGSNSTVNGIGLRGRADDATGIGIQSSGGNLAGQFLGNVSVSGTLTKGGGAFQIDHPLDPENKYLLHSFVESPDMMNVYNGNVTLDAQGRAVVTLPDWFEALNRDFRYQLTSVGAPGPNLYVADEVSGNQFTIAGGTPNGRVSWQVTGIRQDAWANANRVPVEKPKSDAEAGRFLHPAARGLSADMGVERAGGAETVIRRDDQ